MTKPQLDLFDFKKIKDFTVNELKRLSPQLRTYISNLEYYGSHINRYISKSLPRNHDCMNLDLLQYKSRYGVMRFSEVKHLKESLGRRQEFLLKKLADVARFTNETPTDKRGSYGLYNMHIDVFVIYGNVNESNEIEEGSIRVHDLVNNEKYIITDQKDIDLWLGLEKVDITKYKESFNPYVSARRAEEDARHNNRKT